MILIADLGATNARFCMTDDGTSYFHQAKYPINNFDSLEDLLSLYFSEHKVTNPQKAVIGVAAPITEDSISFINIDLEFSKQKLKKNFFPKGLIVVNDLELQAHALLDLDQRHLSYIGELRAKAGPKILISPGTGLGLAGIIGGKVISTEAGHINISTAITNDNLAVIINEFMIKEGRAPTYEDFLSGKGISRFYTFFSNDKKLKLTNEEILAKRNDSSALQAINLLNYLLASYLRYVTLVWGATGGVFLSGSIVNSLVLAEDYQNFRDVFESSDTMRIVLESAPIAIVRDEEIGFLGGMEIAKKLLN